MYRSVVSGVSGVTVALLSMTSPVLAGPPSTVVETVTERMGDLDVPDPYRWLEDLEVDSPRVAEWTTAQNDYTRGILDQLPGRDALAARIEELMSIGEVGAPVMRGNWYFNTQRRGDQNQAVLYVREGADGAPRVLLDPNTLDERGLYALDWFRPSPDGALVAFGLSHAGDEMTVLYVLETATGNWLADEIPGKIGFSGWAPNGRAFLYGKLEDPDDAYSRSFRMHQVGRHHRLDEMLLMQDAPSRIPGAFMARDGRWIGVQFFEGWAKQDVYAVDATAWARNGEPEMIPVAVGLDAECRPQAIVGDTMYLFTTKDAPKGMLYAVDLTKPAMEHWEVVLPEHEQAVLRSVSVARGMLVANYQQDVTSRLERFTMDGMPLGAVDLPGLGSAGLVTHADRTEAFMTYTSFNEPSSIYHVDLASNERSLWARPDVPVDPSKVVVKQEWCTSADGTRVPMFIVHRKDLVLDGTNPTMLYGYGGFNVTLTPRFIATNFPFMEAGGVYVSVNLRGGGEYGEAWHQAGMLGNKQNVFDDLYAAAEHLFDAGYTSSDHLALMGGSNGGLLAGVAATQRPDLWAAVISAVPLLDMLRYPNFLMAKFWVPEYGDPQDPEHRSWLRAYSPYHNVTPGTTYPAVMFTAGENDNRVHPMHARKMAALMQAESSNDHAEDPILLWVDREAATAAANRVISASAISSTAGRS